MTTRDRVRLVRFGTAEAEIVRRALLSEQRMRLLGILAKRDLTVGEIAEALGISQPNASVHVHALEQAGMLSTRPVPGSKGQAKACSLTFDNLVFQRAFHPDNPREEFTEVSMPVGLFTSIHPVGICGWSTADGAAIGRRDQGLLSPERIKAQLIWLEDGWVEYGFSIDVPRFAELAAIDVEAELSSTAPLEASNQQSDITVWINDAEIGTWTAPADFCGGDRGILNPDWWSPRWSQHGILTTWTVEETGSYVDRVKASDISIHDLNISSDRPTVVRFGVKADAANRAGFNIFGQKLGNHPQDLILRYRYKSGNPA